MIRPRSATRSGLRVLLLAAAVGLTALIPASCAVNPATGERQLALIGRAEEIRMGRQGSQQVESTIGVYDADGLSRYVDGLGREMARRTERPDLPWSFAVADEPTVNAFALPGGFIYMTRGIMAHFNSEAELAAVVGHEIAHVTARHSVEQMSRQQLAALGLGLGAVLSDQVARFGDLVGAGLGVLFLKYSREDESQADRLGLRYMTDAGYSPREMVDVFQMFRRQTEEAGGSGVPTWLSTHPTPASRIEELRAIIDTLPEERMRGSVDREGYLRRVAGMVYGPDPRHGFFRGDDFVRPAGDVRVTFPGGWQRQRMSRVVSAGSPNQDAMVRLDVVEDARPGAAADSFFSGQGIEAGSVRETEIHGFPAVVGEFRARGEQVLRGRAAFIGDGPRLYRLLGVSAEASYSRYAGTFRSFVESFDRLRDPELRSVEPLRIELVTPERPTTLAELAESRPGPLAPEALALLNGLEVEESIPPGRTVKWVVGELPGSMQRDGEAGAE
jgi:predicted Zn-dependent protease